MNHLMFHPFDKLIMIFKIFAFSFHINNINLSVIVNTVHDKYTMHNTQCYE